MPKTSNEGPSYAGHVDASGADTVTPEWAPADSVADDVAAVPADVSRETKADDKADDDKGSKAAAGKPARGKAGK